MLLLGDQDTTYLPREISGKLRRVSSSVIGRTISFLTISITLSLSSHLCMRLESDFTFMKILGQTKTTAHYQFLQPFEHCDLLVQFSDSPGAPEYCRCGIFHFRTLQVHSAYLSTIRKNMDPASFAISEALPINSGQRVNVLGTRNRWME